MWRVCITAALWTSCVSGKTCDIFGNSIEDEKAINAEEKVVYKYSTGEVPETKQAFEAITYENDFVRGRALENYLLKTQGGKHRLSYTVSGRLQGDGDDGISSTKANMKEKLIAGINEGKKNPSAHSEMMHPIAGFHTAFTLVGAFLNLGIMDAIGLYQTISQLIKVDADGVPLIDWTSTEGIVTALSMPSRFIGVAFAPIFAAEAVRTLLFTTLEMAGKVLTNFRTILSGVRGMARVSEVVAEFLPFFTSGSTMLAAGTSSRYLLVVTRATEIFQVIAPFLVAADLGVSIYFLVRAVKTAAKNTDDDMTELYAWNVVNLGVSVALTSILLVSTCILAVSQVATIVGASFAVEATAAAVEAGVAVGAAAAGFAMAVAVAGPVALIIGAILIGWMIFSMLRDSKLQNRAACNSADKFFNQYLIRVVRELDYLMQPNKSSSEFNMYRLPGDKSTSYAYVELDRIVVLPKAVIPSISQNFLRQLRDPTALVRQNDQLDVSIQPVRSAKAQHGTDPLAYEMLDGNPEHDIERDVKISSVILPNNLFKTVGSHSCKNTYAKHWHSNIGYCDAEKNMNTYYLDGIANERHYEWIEVSRLDDCKEISRHDFEDYQGRRFCEMRCDQHFLWGFRDGSATTYCNAIKMQSDHCIHYSCGRKFELPESPYAVGAHQGRAMFIRERSINCGGYYAKSCSECLSKDMCNGECYWDNNRCIPRDCGACVFPFSYKNQEHWGCTMEGEKRPWCATQVDAGGKLWGSTYYAFCNEKNDQCRKTCAGYVCEDVQKFVTADLSHVCKSIDCTDTECDCRLPNGAPAVDSPGHEEKCKSIQTHKECVSGIWEYRGTRYNGCSVAHEWGSEDRDWDPAHWFTSKYPKPWCPTTVDGNGHYWKNSNNFFYCDGRDLACFPKCRYHTCSGGNKVEFPWRKCLHWKCTDHYCGCANAKRRRRRMERINTASTKRRAMSANELTESDSERFAVPEDTSRKTLHHWVDRGRKILYTDRSCMEKQNLGTGNKENTDKSRIIVAGTGYASTRHLNVDVHTDELVMQSVNFAIPNAELLGPTPNIIYNISLDGAPDSTTPVLVYTLTMPPMRYHVDLPPERTSSFTYIIHKRSTQMTKLQIELSDYVQHGYTGYVWDGEFGVLEACIRPFTTELSRVEHLWQRRVRAIHRTPDRVVTLFRRIVMGSAVDDRMAFYIKRGTYDCSVDHMSKKYMLEAIIAQDPNQESVWESTKDGETYQYTDVNKVQLSALRLKPLEYVVTLLHKYREHGKVGAFSRDERPVQVLLGDTAHVSFYFNAVSSTNRLWDIFVPRGVQCNRGEFASPLNYRVQSSDDVLLKFQRMISCKVISSYGISVTYAFPSLVHSGFNGTAAISVMLPFVGHPIVKKVTCPQCSRNDVEYALERAAVAGNGTLDQLLSISELVIINTQKQRVNKVVDRDTPIARYSTRRMEKTEYFTYNPKSVTPLGYFNNFPLGQACVMAGEKLSGNVAKLYRSTTLQSHVDETPMVPVLIPSKLSTLEDRGAFTGFAKSTTPGCDGVIATTSDFTKYCITCDVAIQLESTKKGPSWAPLNEKLEVNDSLPVVFDLPLYWYGASSAKSTVEYRGATFPLPDVGKVNPTTDTPWYASQDPTLLRYRFVGVAATGLPGTDFAFFSSPTNKKQCCRFVREKVNCREVREVFKGLTQMNETRLQEDRGIWMLEKAAAGPNYLFSVKRFIADTHDDARVLQNLYPSVLIQVGSTCYFNKCPFRARSWSLLSEGTPPIAYFLDGHETIMSLDTTSCHLQELPNVRLGYMMERRATYPNRLHLDITVPSTGSEGSATVFPVSGYESIAVTFTSTASLSSLSIDVSGEPNLQYLLFVPDTIDEAIVLEEGEEKLRQQRADGTKILEKGDLNVRVHFLEPKRTSLDASARRENALKSQDAELYDLYNLSAAVVFPPPTVCSVECQFSCLDDGVCLNPHTLLTQRGPIWRRQKISDDVIPDDMYCYMQRGRRHCARLHDLYAFIVRTLIPHASEGKRRESARRSTGSFGVGVLCPDDTCASETIKKVLRSSAYAGLMIGDESDPTFMLRQSADGDWALWPDFQKRSPGGFAGATRLSMKKGSCPDQPPDDVRRAAKADPDGFGRLVEHVYFRENIGGWCVRITASIADLPMAKKVAFADRTFDDVDIRQSTIHSLLDSLAQLSKASQTYGFTIDHLKSSDISWSLYEDKFGKKIFDRYGGFTVNRWPQSGSKEAGFTRLTKTLLHLLHVPGAESIDDWIKHKERLSGHWECHAPVLIEPTTERFLLHKEIYPLSMDVTVVGMYNIDFKSPHLVDGSCYEYVVAVAACNRKNAMIYFNVTYNGVDWDPTMSSMREVADLCRFDNDLPPKYAQYLKPQPPVVSAAHPVPTLSTQCGHSVRLRVKNTEQLCTMSATRSRDIRAVQLYERVGEDEFRGRHDASYSLKRDGDGWTLRNELHADDNASNMRPDACFAFANKQACISSKDNREKYRDSPCIWCCGNFCTRNKNKCEPLEFLKGRSDWNRAGQSKFAKIWCDNKHKCTEPKMTIDDPRFVIEDPMQVPELVADVMLDIGACKPPVKSNATWECLPQPVESRYSLYDDGYGHIRSREEVTDDVVFDRDGDAVLDVKGKLSGSAGVGYLLDRSVSDVETLEECRQICESDDKCHAYSSAIQPSQMSRYYTPNALDTECQLYKLPYKKVWTNNRYSNEELKSLYNEVQLHVKAINRTRDRETREKIAKMVQTHPILTDFTYSSETREEDRLELRDIRQELAEKFPTTTASIFGSGSRSRSSSRGISENPAAKREFCAIVEPVDPCCPRVPNVDESPAFCVSSKCQPIQGVNEKKKYVCSMKFCAPCKELVNWNLWNGTTIPTSFNGKEQCAVGCRELQS